MSRNSNLALQTWVSANLGITQRELSLDRARRWQQLRMRHFETFCAIAIFGFVQRRRRDGAADAYPEEEFADFLGEFCLKLDAVLQRRKINLSLDLFERVGQRKLRLALPGDDAGPQHHTHRATLGK